MVGLPKLPERDLASVLKYTFNDLSPVVLQGNLPCRATAAAPHAWSRSERAQSLRPPRVAAL
jgi:hypothetical protein